MRSGSAVRAVVLLAILLAAAACGRRGALEPAADEGAAPARTEEAAAQDTDPVASQLPRRKKVKKITPPAGPTALDWLL